MSRPAPHPPHDYILDRLNAAADAAARGARYRSPAFTIHELLLDYTLKLRWSIQADLWFIDHGFLPQPRAVAIVALEYVADRLEENLVASAAFISAMWFLPPVTGADRWERITAILQQLGVIGREQP